MEELLEIVKGPDFPTGATILGRTEESRKLTVPAAVRSVSVR